MSSKLQLSNTSFTNKDFNDAYPELLELAKKLSYKWDPTVSNESDPGVVLIKEMALAIDKINYASDKNALETMPLSVSQQRTARQLFQVLGYYPKWYMSAGVTVALSWSPQDESYSDTEPTTIYLPAFTQIVDDSGDYVYAIPQNTPLKSNGEVQYAEAIQGIVKELKINNTNLIKYELLDQNRRVYFPDYNIAQNGVFIINADADNSKSQREYWTQKDNLGVEEVGNTYYSFGVDVTTGRCYVEFPVDINDLIRDGLHIYYLVTAGRDGAVITGQLNKLYNNTATCVVKNSNSEEETTVSVDNQSLRLQNTELLYYGTDPESINSMYENYNHIKGTFDTLVTLRDYNNAAYMTEKCSNAVVTDRTNDVQRSYRIMSQTLTGSENVIYMQEKEDGENKISPFALKIYALQYSDLTDTNDISVNQSSYNQTFEMFDDLDVEDPFDIDSSLRQLTMLLNDERCVQHDFNDIESNKICLLKNVAEISMTVFPTVSLTQLQKETLANDIKNKIYKTYNARNVEFGDEINYDDLFTNLVTSSSYIKNLALNQIEYFTYALYHSEGEEWVDTFQSGNTVKLKDQWRQVCISNTVDYIKGEIPEEFNTVGTGYDTTFNDMEVNLAGNSSKITKEYKGYHPYVISDVGTAGSLVFYLDNKNNLKLYSTKRDEFRKEILIKNVLAGVTPLFITKDPNFKYQIDEQNKQLLVSDIDVTTDMLFKFDGSTARYNLNPNEVAQFTKQQLLDVISYKSYVKYDYVGRDVPANQPHRLSANEQLVIYYKTEDSDVAPYVRAMFGMGSDDKNAIIEPNFALTQTTTSINLNVPANETPITALTCSANQGFTIKEKNSVTLRSATQIYVIGNQYKDDDGFDYYKIEFKQDSNGTWYTELKTDESFLYVSSESSALNIVGSGTRIEINDPTFDGVIKNKVVSTFKITLLGTAAISGYWQDVPSNTTLIGQEFVNVIGYETSSENNENGAYIEISTKQEYTLNQDIILTRGGFKWANASEGTPYEVKVESCIAKDISGVHDSQIITPLSQNLWNNFVFSANNYGATEHTSFNSTVSFVSANYPEETLSTYDSNGFPVQVSGTVSDIYKQGNVDYKYLFNGATIYLANKMSDGSWNAGRLYGFPLNCSPEYEIEQNQGSDVCTIKNGSTAIPIPAGRSVIVYNTDLPLSAQLVGDGAIFTNTDSEAKQTFTTSYRIGGYKAKLCDYYVCREGYYTDYNNPQKPKYRIANGDIDTVPVYQIGPDDGLIIVPIYNITEQESSTPNYYFLILPKLTNLYDVPNGSNNDAKMTRHWEYTDAKGLVKQISDEDFFTNVIGNGNASWPDWEGWDRWTWPIWNAQIELNLFYMYSTGDVDPSFFLIRYKNQGEDVQDLVFSQDGDLQWKASGLATLDMSGEKSCELYKNQKLYLTAKDVSADDNINFNSGYEMWFVYVEDDQQGNLIYNAEIKYPGETVEEIEDVQHLYLCSSDDLYIEGYDSVNLELLDSSGYTYYPTILFTFDKYKASADYKKGVYPNKKIVIQKNFNDELEFELPDSNEHIFSIRNYQNFGEGSVLYVGAVDGLSCLTVDVTKYPHSLDSTYAEVEVDDLGIQTLTVDYISYPFEDKDILGVNKFLNNEIGEFTILGGWDISVIGQVEIDNGDETVSATRVKFTFGENSVCIPADGSDPCYPKDLPNTSTTMVTLIVQQPNGNGVYDLSNKGVYQFRISNVDSLSLPIVLQDNDQEDRVIRVEIEPIVAVDGAQGVFSFGYPVNTFIEDLKDYSYVNGKNAFNFFCVPDANKRIDDPLESTSFNNHNHFYNPFTICKVREYNILGKSNIFVNN